MTRDQDIDRVLDHWFTEGPTQMPDRFLTDTLDRIDRAPQPRLARLRTRLPVMNVTVRLAAIAAVIVIAVGVGFVLPRLPSAATAVPTATPTATPTAVPTEAVTPLVDPSMLIAKWASVGERAFPKSPADSLAALKIDATTLSMNGWKGPIDGSWSLTPDRHLVVTMRTGQADLTMQHFDCRPGQEGSYTVRLAADGKTMTLTPIRDDCLGRSDVMTGRWTRWPCPNPDSVCAPELTPGLHRSSFEPSGDPSPPASSPPVQSGYTYIVPAGWSSPQGVSSQNILARQNDPATMAIRLTPDVAPRSQGANCPDDVEPGVGSSPADLATWLKGLPGSVTTTPRPVTIGGHTGLLLDVSVNPALTLPCVQFYQSAPAGIVYPFRDPVEPLEGNAHSRYILLEFGQAHTLLIEISAPDEVSWNDLVQAGMPIVETFEFTR
jgi:hypothetical protein